MIKYNLICENKHEFESWFSDSREFENLKSKKLLECIYCSSKKINKSIMSPMVSRTAIEKDELNKLNKMLENEKKNLLKIRKYVEKNFENVGKNLSKKVREIYYNKDGKKTIYGTVTQKERNELAEEGIDLISIPWVEKDN
ncbi:MAG: DUF1178 family protein [Pseudomonadota bacterium]|nr:DUF1178 family protein [Pseudomonadota bacterium]